MRYPQGDGYNKSRIQIAEPRAATQNAPRLLSARCFLRFLLWSVTSHAFTCRASCSLGLRPARPLLLAPGGSIL